MKTNEKLLLLESKEIITWWFVVSFPRLTTQSSSHKINHTLTQLFILYTHALRVVKERNHSDITTTTTKYREEEIVI